MKRTKRVVAVCLVLATVFTIACAPQAAPAPAPRTAAPSAAPAPVPAASVPSAPARPAWKVEWDRVMEVAKKEGRVVIPNTGGNEMRTIIIRGLKDAYGLNAESITGRSAEIAVKVFAERRAGLYLNDVYISSYATMLYDLKPAGVIQRLDSALILPEVTDPKLWFAEKLPWLDKDHTGFAFSVYPGRAIAINSNLVKPDELKSWKDLLNPKWKGKMALNDPTTPGAGQLSMLAMDLIMGWDYVKELAKAEPLIMRDQRQQLDWLAHGKISVLVAPKPDLYAEFVKAGAPVGKVDMVEGTWLTCAIGAIALFDNAPHPNAAKVFLNWVLSKEGQTLFTNATLQQSARLDIPLDALPADMVRQAGVKYVPIYDEVAIERRTVTDKLAKEVFGALLKK